ncbi:hypothetical protein J19TS2_26110 [Cohnella xylanilytica]|uniref:Transposase n=1 Tax=Cohnella xylanilytica TaxID=557555 RepID=A0A841TQ60_9BACL|nr:transposase [Cohnella xylanilytica]MBB6689849.1 transposase [Cohnella xylanilytica]GIO13056.1 hypothetical protein J19TS2_26110 [Cohnella xylanilytica]
MSENSNNDMLPISGEHVEADGVYKNEWGRELELQRGDVFPPDPQLGTTEWEWAEMTFDNHHEGTTDPRLVPKKDDINKRGKILHPRRQMDRGKK